MSHPRQQKTSLEKRQISLTVGLDEAIARSSLRLINKPWGNFWLDFWINSNEYTPNVSWRLLTRKLKCSELMTGEKIRAEQRRGLNERRELCKHLNSCCNSWTRASHLYWLTSNSNSLVQFPLLSFQKFQNTKFHRHFKNTESV